MRRIPFISDLLFGPEKPEDRVKRIFSDKYILYYNNDTKELVFNDKFNKSLSGIEWPAPYRSRTQIPATLDRYSI